MIPKKRRELSLIHRGTRRKLKIQHFEHDSPKLWIKSYELSPVNIWAATWENRIFPYAKTKTQISFAVTAKLISAFVFATRTVQSLSFLNTKFQASSQFLRAAQPDLCGTWSETPKTGFLTSRLIWTQNC